MKLKVLEVTLNVDYLKKTNFMALFYGWGSTASRLHPLRGGSLLFTIQFPEIPGPLNSTSVIRPVKKKLAEFFQQ